MWLAESAQQACSLTSHWLQLGQVYPSWIETAAQEPTTLQPTETLEST